MPFLPASVVTIPGTHTGVGDGARDADLDEEEETERERDAERDGERLADGKLPKLIFCARRRYVPRFK